MERQAGHLREITHRRFGDIGLPVGVRGEARRRVESQVRPNRRQTLGVEREHPLETLNRIQREHADEAEEEHPGGVGRPPLLGRRVYPADAINDPLDGR